MSSIRIEIHGKFGGPHKNIRFFVDEVLIIEYLVTEGMAMTHDIGRIGGNTYELVVTEMELLDGNVSCLHG